MKCYTLALSIYRLALFPVIDLCIACYNLYGVRVYGSIIRPIQNIFNVFASYIPSLTILPARRLLTPAAFVDPAFVKIALPNRHRCNQATHKMIIANKY